jgi:hypothetical protein
MTPLQHSILQTLRKDGPLSDLGIWCKTRDREITFHAVRRGRRPCSGSGGLVSTIVIVCLQLEEEGYIEPPPNDPHSWQLSNKGLEYVAACKSQEVPLGAN